MWTEQFPGFSTTFTIGNNEQTINFSFLPVNHQFNIKEITSDIEDNCVYFFKIL